MSTEEALRDIEQHLYDVIRGMPALVFSDLPHGWIMQMLDTLQLIQADNEAIMRAHGLTPRDGDALEEGEMSEVGTKALETLTP